MAKIDWSQESESFERFPVLKMKVGEKATVVFEDEGNLVDAALLKEAASRSTEKKKTFPRDSIVFLVSKANEKMEFWVGAKNYSIRRQIAAIAKANGNKLTGCKAKIERVSDSQTETNYIITKA